MVCTACPGGTAVEAAHCEGCGQHIAESVNHPGVFTGVACRAECIEHPSGYHHPPSEGSGTVDGYIDEHHSDHVGSDFQDRHTEHGPSDYTCVRRPKCKHYPRTGIPRGEEAWVTVPGGMQESRHRDCVDPVTCPDCGMEVHIIGNDQPRYSGHATMGAQCPRSYQPINVDGIREEG